MQRKPDCFMGVPTLPQPVQTRKVTSFFYTLAGAGLIEQNEQHIELPQGAALLMNCRTPQSYCTAPGYDVWEHYWVHLDGVGVKTLADSVQSQGRLTAAHVSRMEMQPLFETLFAEWKKGDHHRPDRNWVDTAQNAGTACPPAAFRGRKPFQPDHDQADCRLYPCTLCGAHQSGYAAGADPCQQKAGFCGFSGNIWAQHRTIFLLSTRITRAKELLVLTDFPVGEVARQVGFEDESNFSTRFSSMTGQSPQQYRKKRTEAFCPKFINTRQSTVS